jgi:PIN domain nuclease of toxin-antitoxin system
VRLLLDTHVLLWWSTDSPRLQENARDAIRSAGRVVVSAASAWEAAIKARSGKLTLNVPFDAVAEVNGFEKLPITFAHAAAVATLPEHHRDPFDRMLVAQAQTEGHTLVTHDRALEPYGIPILWT